MERRVQPLLRILSSRLQAQARARRPSRERAHRVEQTGRAREHRTPRGDPNGATQEKEVRGGGDEGRRRRRRGRGRGG